MPLAVSATTLSGPQHATVDERHDVLGEVVEQVAVLARCRGAAGAGPAPASIASAVALISASPVSSPTGRAPGQAQLDAVVLGRVVRRGEHRAGRVEAAGGEVERGRSTPARGRPRRRPASSTPSAKRRDERRRPTVACRGATSTRGRPANRAKATPMAWHSSASS